jgi:uncharacterized OsmC-like protein
MEEKTVTFEIDRVHDYEFRVRFGEGLEWITDKHAPLGGGRGPDPVDLFSVSVANCLTASLLFCLRKARIEPTALSATATTTLVKDDRGLHRVRGVHVAIRLGTAPEDAARVGRCLELYEDYCTITQSVRRGVPVEVDVLDAEGAPLAALRASPTR